MQEKAAGLTQTSAKQQKKYARILKIYPKKHSEYIFIERRIFAYSKIANITEF